METQTSNYEMHDALDFLTAYAVSEQDRINALDLPDGQKQTEMKQLINELTAACPYVGKAVSISGDRIFRLPMIGQEVVYEEGTTKTTAFECTYEDSVAFDSDDGFSYGFAARKVPLVIDGIDFGSSYKVCHMIHTGEMTNQTDDESNLHIIKHMAYFPIGESSLSIRDEFYAHDIRELRRSQGETLDELYEDIDDVLFNGELELAERLADLQSVLTDHSFGELSLIKQRETVSYLNQVYQFQYLNIFGANYGIDANKRDVVSFSDYHMYGTFNKFTLDHHYDIAETANGDMLATPVGNGVCIAGEMLRDELHLPVIIPLNQELRFLNLKI